MVHAQNLDELGQGKLRFLQSYFSSVFYFGFENTYEKNQRKIPQFFRALRAENP